MEIYMLNLILIFTHFLNLFFPGREGFVEWKDNWITFLDALLLFYMFASEDKSFVLPTGALSFKICPKIFKSCAEECLKEGLPGKFLTTELIFFSL